MICSLVAVQKHWFQWQVHLFDYGQRHHQVWRKGPVLGATFHDGAFAHVGVWGGWRMLRCPGAGNVWFIPKQSELHVARKLTSRMFSNWSARLVGFRFYLIYLMDSCDGPVEIAPFPMAIPMAMHALECKVATSFVRLLAPALRKHTSWEWLALQTQPKDSDSSCP